MSIQTRWIELPITVDAYLKNQERYKALVAKGEAIIIINTYGTKDKQLWTIRFLRRIEPLPDRREVVQV